MCGILRNGTDKHPRHTLKWVSIDPSTTSRLGDLGYVDKKGCWRVVLNIFDRNATERLGIKALALQASLGEYVVQNNVIPFDDPIVELRPQGSYRLIALDGSKRLKYHQRNETNRQGRSVPINTLLAKNIFSHT
jgi:hypothetical protein